MFIEVTDAETGEYTMVNFDNVLSFYGKGSVTVIVCQLEVLMGNTQKYQVLESYEEIKQQLIKPN